MAPKTCCGCGPCPKCCGSDGRLQGWDISFSAGWGSAVGDGCNICNSIGTTFPSPVFVPFPVSGSGAFWLDTNFGVSDSYVRVGNRACIGSNVFVGRGGPINCNVQLATNLYKDATEAGCRLMAYFYSSSFTLLAAYYRSTVISDCCSPLTLSLYTVGGGFNIHCPSQPATITATPRC